MRTLLRLWRWLWATDEAITDPLLPDQLRGIVQAEPKIQPPLRRVK